MKKETYDKLKEYDKVLGLAVNNNFIHMTATDFNKIADIYAELYGELSKKQKNCNTCRLKALKKIGTEYFEYKNKKKGKKNGKEENGGNEG